jgi:hypothetical protein
LTNPGKDWVNLGFITLNPYVPILGAYQIGNSNFAALWLWHRTNIYYTNATATVSGTLPLSGLQPGSYAATWWDTFAGVALSNFTFTVAGTNAATLATPPILRSVALYAGPPPQAAVIAPGLTQILGTNSPALLLPLAITNGGGLPLAYSLCVTGINPVAYAAINSTQPGGPVFAWQDISGVGRDLTASFTALTTKAARDEGIAGPIDIGFSFPFFSGAQSPGIFTQLYVSPNGFIAFSPFAGDTSTNRPLPSTQAPSNSIAFFWDDLDLSTAGKVYCATDSLAGTFTLQFQSVPIKGTSTNVTCQLILKTSGEILMQFKTIGISNACTLGVQNAARNQGLKVAYNQNYLQSDFAVRLNPAPWLGLARNAGLVPGCRADVVNLSLNPAGLAAGSYTARLLVQTADPALPLTVLPITLNILNTPIERWRFANFGIADNAGIAADTADPDHDGLVNIFEYAFNTNPNLANPSPISYAVVSNHLTITFTRTHPPPADISYWFDVTDNLTSATWQSGPPFTTLTAADNRDGTETVTVIDNALVPSSSAHYLRVRISRP